MLSVIRNKHLFNNFIYQEKNERESTREKKIKQDFKKKTNSLAGGSICQRSIYYLF